MARQRISDIITMEEIENEWSLGMKILIRGQTGMGKSYWAQNVLYDYCKKNEYKCLFFSNRNVLKNQNELSLVGKEDVFESVNYQNVSEKIYGGIPLSDVYNGFDVIVLDEIHYVLEDAPFNRKTDLLMKSLKHIYPNKLFILMTATPQMLFTYKSKYDKVYEFPDDYSYINELKFYKSNETIKKLIERMPDNEKAIYFARSAEDAYKLSQTFFNKSSFVCSPEKKTYGKLSDKDTLLVIAMEKKFPQKVLCSTKLLDTGINIEDEAVKTIIIESSDPINIIQSIGRKRVVNDDDKLNIYIRNVHGGNITQRKNECLKNLMWANELRELGKEEFQFKHRKANFPEIIDNDITINVAIELYYKFMLKFYESLEGLDVNFRKYFYKHFQYKPIGDEFLETEIQKPDIIKVLEETEGIMFIEEDEKKEIAKRIFSVVLSSGVSNVRSMGYSVISKMLKRGGIPYEIKNIRIKKGVNRDKTYWTFIRKDEGGKSESD